MEHIQANEAIIHKVIGLYIDAEEEKQDLYQEVLLQAWKSFHNFRSEAKFSTWLYRVTLNTVFNFNKKHKKKYNQEPLIDIDPKVEPPNAEYEILYKIIKSLNPVDKMIMTLHLDGYKNKEIAEITGMNNNHLNVKILRIKANIIDKFKRINDE